MAPSRSTTETSKTARAKLRIIAARYGEAGASPYLLPLSVDGLVVVASISLVELAGRIRTAEQAPTRDLDVSSAGLHTPPAHPAPPSTPGAGATADGVRPRPAAPATLAAPTTGKDDDGPLELDRLPAVEHDSDGMPAPRAAQQRRDTGDGDRDDEQNEHHAGAPSVTTTAEAVAYWRHKDPSLQPAEIALKIGKSERTVFRYWPPAQKPSRTRRSGHGGKGADLVLTTASERR